MQLYTVPSIARWLFSEHDVVNHLLDFVLQGLRSSCDEAGHLMCETDDSFLSAGTYASVLHDIRFDDRA